MYKDYKRSGLSNKTLLNPVSLSTQLVRDQQNVVSVYLLIEA